MKQVLLFSITADDCDWSSQTAGGPGGQHRNRSQTAIRCVHRESGAVGYASDNRSQLINKREAFVRMSKTPEFKKWHKLETARRMLGYSTIEQMIRERVDLAMAPGNIKIEVQDENGRWIEV